MNSNVEYILKEDYLIRTFSGDIYFSALVESWQYLLEHDLKKDKYRGVINDFTAANLKIELDELKQLLNYFKLNRQVFKKLKLAVIMTTPEGIIFPILAKEMSNFNIQAFSTLESAEDWIIFDK